MNSTSNTLLEGQRLWWDGRPAILLERDINYHTSNNFNVYNQGYRITYTVRFEDAEGGSVSLSADSDYAMYRSIPYYEYSGFQIGDTMEIKRDGLEPNLRGRLLEIDKDAERYGYRVGEEGGTSIWFSFAELIKIHSVTSRERSPRAVEVLKKTIAEKREELEALETALEVLEYATT